MKDNIKFTFAKETVIVNYGVQSICYHSYYEPRKASLRKFRKEIETNPEIQISEVISLGNKYEIPFVSKGKIHVIM